MRKVYIETTERQMEDPIVEEVRKYRMKHTLKSKGDLGAICEDLRSIQRASGHRVVRLPAEKVQSRGRATRFS